MVFNGGERTAAAAAAAVGDHLYITSATRFFDPSFPHLVQYRIHTNSLTSSSCGVTPSPLSAYVISGGSLVLDDGVSWAPDGGERGRKKGYSATAIDSGDDKSMWKNHYIFLSFAVSVVLFKLINPSQDMLKISCIQSTLNLMYQSKEFQFRNRFVLFPTHPYP